MSAMPSSLEDLVGAMTISELAQRSGRTVEAIASFALGSSIRPARNSPASAPRDGASTRGAKKAKGRAKSAGPDTSFDERVLAAIAAAGGEARSVDIENEVGGTTEERRAALHRLVAAKKLKRSGVARGTRYAVR
jgi:hypothetical protein